MKRNLVLLVCAATLLFAAADSSVAHQRVSVSFGIFYNSLSPYGEWISVGAGVYGWRPLRVEVGWRPYTIGRWVWTDDGWYWVSDEPWGWAAYHYGRWHYDDYYGWIWIPGYDWAPAWVEWRYGPDYIGWAPLSPYAVFSVSWGVHYRTRWYTPAHWWIFAGCNHITSPHLRRYVFRSEHNTRYIGVTRTGGSVRYSGGRIVTRGPEREFVERHGRVRIEPVGIRDVDVTGRERIVREGPREQIEVYRPRVDERISTDDRSARPERIRIEDGRSVDLDTRKIDVRSREIAREEGREIKQAEEYRDRTDFGRNVEREPSVDRRRSEGMLKGPVDDGTRERQTQTTPTPERRRDEGRAIQQHNTREQRQQDVRQKQQREESAKPNRQPSVQRESRGERREPSVGSPAPQRRQETPSAPRGGNSRNDGGRGGRGR